MHKCFSFMLLGYEEKLIFKNSKRMDGNEKMSPDTLPECF